jgi:ATP phosphoribosyltransferase
VLRVAIPKGRIFGEILTLFQLAEVPIRKDLKEASRKLIVPIPEIGLSFFFAKPMDVPTYVEYGAADVGIAGKDVLLESERDVYELLDLEIGSCRLSIAGLPDWKLPSYPRVATKYPHIAESYFKQQGQQVEVITLHGSIELAPLLGLAESHDWDLPSNLPPVLDYTAPKRGHLRVSQNLPSSKDLLPVVQDVRERGDWICQTTIFYLSDQVLDIWHLTASSFVDRLNRFGKNSRFYLDSSHPQRGILTLVWKHEQVSHVNTWEKGFDHPWFYDNSKGAYYLWLVSFSGSYRSRRGSLCT